MLYQQYGWSPTHLKVDIMTSIDPPVSCSQVQKSLAWLVAVRWRAPCNLENRGFHQFYRQRWGFSWWKWQLLVGRSFFFVKSRLVKVWLDEQFRILLLNLTVFIDLTQCRLGFIYHRNNNCELIFSKSGWDIWIVLFFPWKTKIFMENIMGQSGKFWWDIDGILVKYWDLWASLSISELWDPI